MNTYRSPDALARNFTPTPRELWDPELGKQMAAEALQLAGVADEVGFDYVSVSEHHYSAGMCNPNPALLAAALLGVVRRARIALLGPLASMNNPVRIAEEIAMLDQLSGGRVLALPLRGTPNEFAFYNVAPEETRGRTEEALLLVRKALSEPQPFAWSGTYYEFPVVSVWPGPTQVPHPPLYSSANSPESAAFAAEHRFGAAMSYFGPKAVAERMRSYRESCDAHGWQPAPEQMLFRSFCIVGENEEHAAELVRRASIPRPPVKPQDAPVDARAVDQGYAFGMLQFSGSSEQVAAQMQEFRDLTGVGLLDLSFNFGDFSAQETAEQIRRFAGEVIPRLRPSAVAAA
jgi:alkanesulfonate monooxygenase SsuD/methylene tetrahydromethanopterin reductase-like flavin-dependent oxidoreductase (luciferase family)